MDVRCEKCQTDYELDEAKVTGSGVTVKCTACGHLFKVVRAPGRDVEPIDQIEAFAEERSIGDGAFQSFD